jgi:hypothetical protein
MMWSQEQWFKAPRAVTLQGQRVQGAPVQVLYEIEHGAQQQQQMVTSVWCMCGAVALKS